MGMWSAPSSDDYYDEQQQWDHRRPIADVMPRTDYFSFVAWIMRVEAGRLKRESAQTERKA